MQILKLQMLFHVYIFQYSFYFVMYRVYAEYRYICDLWMRLIASDLTSIRIKHILILSKLKITRRLI